MRKLDSRYGEPSLPEDAWYGFGEDAIWVVDFTEGGAPYGPTRAEMREANERMDSGAPWARAKSILRLAMTTLASGNSEIDVGRVIQFGDGLSRIALGATVEVSPDPAGLSGAYVVLLPGRDATPDLDIRARQEIRLLHRLSKYELPFRIPRVLGAWLSDSSSDGCVHLGRLVRHVRVGKRRPHQHRQRDPNASFHHALAVC